MKNLVDFVPLNQFLAFENVQLEFSSNRKELSNVNDSLKTLIGNNHGFKFFPVHFNEFLLLKDLETKIEVEFETLKIKHCDF